MSVAISSVATAFCTSMMLDADIGFNATILDSSPVYSVQPFQLSQSNPINLFAGRFAGPLVIGMLGEQYNLPFAVVSAAKSDSLGRAAMRVTPSTFSGSVIVSIDFYLGSPGSGQDILLNGENQFHAVEDAIINCFNTASSYAKMPQGLTYNNEIIVEQGLMEFDGPRWLQLVACTLNFNRVG